MMHLKAIESIIALHDAIIKEFGGLSGLRDENLLVAALERPFIGLANGSEFFLMILQKLPR